MIIPNIYYFRSEYYTIPPLHELNQSIDSNGDVFVDDFVVGREGYGQVKFYGRTNVAGLNLDEIGECASHLMSCHVMSCHVMSCHVKSFLFLIIVFINRSLLKE